MNINRLLNQRQTTDTIFPEIYKEDADSKDTLSIANIFKSIGILIVASCIGAFFEGLGLSEINIITIYILGVLINSVTTQNQMYNIIYSIVSVIVFNFFFTEPRYTLRAYDSGYPVTFLVMFLASFITGSLAVGLKNNARQSARAAFRTKILLDTTQLLQQAKGKLEIAAVTAKQLIKLLNKDIIIYLTEKDTLVTPQIFPAAQNINCETYLSMGESSVAAWVLKHNTYAGATTDTFSNANCLYHPIQIKDSVYGVVGIALNETPIDSFENSILLSILGACALALENEKNAREKEEAAILAKNEQLRANLLRAISHDLRTPLTSISGNASNLLSNGDSFGDDMKKQLYSDIYDDSMWLINLVENLLAVTKLEEGKMHLNISSELLEDVITESLRHVNRQNRQHTINVFHKEELLLVKIDARLIVQVVINIVDNAMKYTPTGSEISIKTWKEHDKAIIRIADNGSGVPDDIKPYIFDMFYSGANQIADSRRSLGLGLYLCKSIINIHGGTITVTDNMPHGAVFTFTLPIGEVFLHE